DDDRFLSARTPPHGAAESPLRGSIAPPGPASTVSSGSKPTRVGGRTSAEGHGVLTYDTRAHAVRREPHGDLLRQAYLLTGDPERAHELADRAGRVVEARDDRLGPQE